MSLYQTADAVSQVEEKPDLFGFHYSLRHVQKLVFSRSRRTSKEEVTQLPVSQG
jgi:hypothetical protein